jgi:hypothetical protein
LHGRTTIGIEIFKKKGYIGMPNFRGSVTGGTSDSPEERYRQFMQDFSANQDAQEKKPNPKDEDIQKTTSSFLNQFANQLKDTIGLASKAKERRMLMLQRDGIKKDLQAFRKMLTFLAEVDESYNPEFILQISMVWNHVIDNYSFVKIVDIQRSINTETLQKFIQSFESYPANSDFSLAYYMMHFPGKRWHPFPLMEIFKQLHEEAKKDFPTSKLHEWISMLDLIIPSV